jgi:hypothetical protein
LAKIVDSRPRDEAGIAVIDRPQQTSATLRIRELDRLLARNPDAIELRFERAGLLREQGAYEDAKRDYLELIRRRPTDFTALNDFGALALKFGHTEAARSLYRQAVRHHPDNPTGHVNLGNLLFPLEETDAARAHFEVALRLDPDHIHAHRGMGNLLAAIGDTAGARRHRDKGFRNHFLTKLPYRGDKAPVRVLLLVSAAGGNTPMASFLDDHVFETQVLATEYYDPKVPLPAHDVVFNSIGDADICREGLEASCALLAQTSRPVINHPRVVLKTGRLSNVMRLRGLPNIVVPQMAALPRHLLAGPDAAAVMANGGFSFPVLLRAPGFHTGYHFHRIESVEALVATAAAIPGDDVWLIEQLDARDGEGMFRKLRVMMIDGRIYPLHLAISSNWKVHYFTANMAESVENRSVDAAFLNDMVRFIGPRGAAGLERIRATLGLDYGGVDFALNAQGDILFFEANATMVMAPLAAGEKWDYRRPAFDAVFAAVRAMLVDRANRSAAALA